MKSTHHQLESFVLRISFPGIVFLLFSYCFSPVAHAQLSAVYGTPSTNEFMQAVAADGNGNAYYGGLSGSNGWLIKRNQVGQLIWSVQLPQSGSNLLEVIDLKIAGDTLFGCGMVRAGTSIQGGFYFKINPATGATYWLKSESTSKTYFSTISYANGKCFLSGAQQNGATGYNLKVVCVTSADGSIAWQTDALGILFQNYNTDYTDDAAMATEMVNGKMYLTGRSYVNGANTLDMRAQLIGIDDQGNVFLKKYLMFNTATSGVNRYYGTSVRYDGADSLVLTFFGDDNCSTCSDYHMGLLKTDLNGNVRWIRSYDFPNYTVELSRFLNVTPSGYTIVGALNYSSAPVIVAFNTDKQGNFILGKLISLSGYSMSVFNSVVNIGASAQYLNGRHYFPEGGYTSNSSLKDAIMLVLDDNLDDGSSCFTFTPITPVQTSIAPYSENLLINSYPDIVAFSTSPATTPNAFADPCAAYAVNVTHYTACSGADSIIAAVTGPAGGQFSWSDGQTGNTVVTANTDTLFLTVFNLANCCVLHDTVLPIIQSASFTLSLPPDTVLSSCEGTAIYQVVPDFSLPTGTYTYSWSNANTGSSMPTSFTVDSTGVFWLTVSTSCLSITDSIHVTFQPQPFVLLPPDIDTCGSAYPFTLYPQTANLDSFSWTDDYSTIDRTITAPGLYILSGSSSCGTASDSIQISTIPNPTVNAGADVDTCVMSQSIIHLAAVSQYEMSISWNTGATTSAIQVSNSGQYWVNAVNECGISSDTVNVDIHYYPSLNLPAELDTCLTEHSVYYTANGSGGSFLWNTGETTATVLISTPGIYYCTMTNICGSVTDSVTVQNISVISLVHQDSLQVCSSLTPVSGLYVQANYPFTISAPYSHQPVSQISSTGWYKITVTSPCTVLTDSVYVEVLDELDYYIPNAFTPDGDEFNNTFNPVIPDELEANYSFFVYDRWGEIIFESHDIHTGWDGTYHGQLCPQGIYVYRLSVDKCSGSEEISGHIALLR